jgi:hypothetical protein
VDISELSHAHIENPPQEPTDCDNTAPQEAAAAATISKDKSRDDSCASSPLKVVFPGGGELGAVHILLRPGHFDLLYSRHCYGVNETSDEGLSRGVDNLATMRELEVAGGTGVGVMYSDGSAIDCAAGGSIEEEEEEEEDGVDVIMPVVWVTDGAGEEEYVDTATDFNLSTCVEPADSAVKSPEELSHVELDMPVDRGKESQWWVACAYPRIADTVYGIAVLTAMNANASSGDMTSTLSSHFSDEATSPSGADAGGTGHKGVPTLASEAEASSEFVMIVNTGTDESLYNGGWEDVDADIPLSHKSLSQSETSAPRLMEALGPVFTVLAIPKTCQDCWDANDSSWRAIEWFNESDMANVEVGFGLGHIVDSGRALRVFNIDRYMSLPGENGHPQAIDAIAIVEGTVMCRIAIRGLSCLGQSSRHRPLPHDMNLSPLRFEVIQFGDWIGDAAGDVSGDGGGKSGRGMGTDVCLLTDLKQFATVANTDIKSDSNRSSETATWCKALTATLGLDDEVYTILTDEDILAQYMHNEHHIQEFQSGLECQIVSSGEVAVMVHVVVCGRSEKYLHRPRQVQLVIPLSAFSSMHMLTSYMLRELHLHPLLAIQICVRDGDTSSKRCADEAAPAVCLRVLSEASKVLAWCTARYATPASSACRRNDLDREDVPYFSLYVKYCEAAVGGTACETIFGPLRTPENDGIVHSKRTDRNVPSGTTIRTGAGGSGYEGVHVCRADDIVQVSKCGHLVCRVCLIRHLVLFSNDSKCIPTHTCVHISILS